MDVYELKRKHLQNHPTSHFFDAETLKFFGESMSRMYVLKGTVKIFDYLGDPHECYVLSKQGKNFLGQKTRTYAYFDTKTFENIQSPIDR